MTKARQAEGNRVHFMCPGCHVVHGIVHSQGIAWDWNGSLDAPTFTPSILVRSDYQGTPYICHSFVTDGRIEFLSDSTHWLSGKTVPLPDWEQ